MEISALKTFGEDRNPINCKGVVDSFVQRFMNAMDSDMNTPKALAVLHEFSSFINKNVSCMSIDELEFCFSKFKELCWILGIFERYRRVPTLSEDLARMIKEREIARKEKNFEKADAIRNRFRDMGIILIDTPKGTRWKLIN